MYLFLIFPIQLLHIGPRGDGGCWFCYEPLGKNGGGGGWMLCYVIAVKKKKKKKKKCNSNKKSGLHDYIM